jgi:hypothetical protein
MISDRACFASRRVLNVCVVFTALACASGCGLLSPACQLGASRCDGNVLEVCTPGGDDAPGGTTAPLGPWWNGTTCAASCEASGTAAACVDAATPIDAAVDFATPVDACGDADCI